MNPSPQHVLGHPGLPITRQSESVETSRAMEEVRRLRVIVIFSHAGDFGQVTESIHNLLLCHLGPGDGVFVLEDFLSFSKTPPLSMVLLEVLPRQQRSPGKVA